MTPALISVRTFLRALPVGAQGVAFQRPLAIWGKRKDQRAVGRRVGAQDDARRGQVEVAHLVNRHLDHSITDARRAGQRDQIAAGAIRNRCIHPADIRERRIG